MAFRNRVAFLTTASALAYSVGLHAAYAGAQPIVITATKIATPIDQVGSSVSLVTRDDLDREGATFAIEGLRRLPGISVSENGGPGGLASVRIRGEEAYRTLILIDGIRISDPAATQVSANLTGALAADVGRIEVVRGPQSLLYGADAIGGVIQILTPDPKPGWDVMGQVDGGAYQTRSAAGGLSYGGGAFSALLQGSAFKTGGFSAKEGDPDLDDPDGLTAYAVHGKADLALATNLRIEAVGRLSSSDAEFDGGSASIFGPADPNRLMKTREAAGRVELRGAFDQGRIRSALSYTVSATNRDDLDDGLPFIFGSQFDGTRRRASWLTTIDAAANQQVLIGADQETLRVTTDSSSDRSSQFGVYSEWQAGFASHFFTTLGLRFDHDDDFGNHLSGRTAAAYLFTLAPGETSRLHSSYGTGFRAPSLFEQATNTAALLPQLREETSRGFDLGFEQSLFSQSATIDVTYFDQTINNEIRFDNVGFSGYFQSTGKSQSRGVEASAQAEQRIGAGWLDHLRLDLAYTHTDATVHSPDAENGLPRVRRPKHMGLVALGFFTPGDKADLTVSIRMAVDAQDGFREFRVPLDDYGILDLSARYRVTPRLELYIKGVNLTNEQYEEVAGFATSDAALYAGIRLRP